MILWVRFLAFNFKVKGPHWRLASCFESQSSGFEHKNLRWAQSNGVQPHRCKPVWFALYVELERKTIKMKFSWTHGVTLSWTPKGKPQTTFFSRKKAWGPCKCLIGVKVKRQKANSNRTSRWAQCNARACNSTWMAAFLNASVQLDASLVLFLALI
jgi:hypothetical protein